MTNMLGMNFEYPLIRFDNRKRLEELQIGSFFMRPICYYQTLEGKDNARKDIYDGSIPFPDENGIIESMTGIKSYNQRFTVLDKYVKCFFVCREDNFSVTSSGMIKFSPSQKTKKAIMDFECDSALIIASPSRFVYQLKKEALNNRESCSSGEVKYFDNTGYQEAVRRLLAMNLYSKEIMYYKPIEFSAQQEYRICIDHPLDGIDSVGEETAWIVVERDIINKVYEINIGEVKDSYILSVDNLLNNGFLIDKLGHYYIGEE